MANVLTQIIDGVIVDLRQRQQTVSPSEIEIAAARAVDPLDVAAVLNSREQLHVIAEVKRASPSKGALSDIVDPAGLARSYEVGGASVISVLTEGRRFGGSLEDLAAVRAAVGIPLLRKDFIVEPYQVFEARAWGADLVLLIVAALSDNDLAELLTLTRSLGMQALVEVHDEDEARRAGDLGAWLVGVNTRDLRTLEVRRDTFGRVAPYLPPSATLVAESGIRNSDDVVTYTRHGAHAVLVGEALVREDDPGAVITTFIEAGKAHPSLQQTGTL
ncbi:MAG: indole-3-glycerol phosphate synthase TrpC [Ornithinimicrobium sp.]